MNWKPEPEFGGFYAAIDILKSKNIDLKIVEGGSATPTVQMLAAKTVPLAIMGGDELMTSRERGMDLKAIFSVYKTNPHALMVREESPWTNIKDILMDKEATIAVTLGLPYVTLLKKMFPEMKARFVPYQGGVTTFVNKPHMAQQCFVSSEPLLAKRAGVKTKTFPISTLGFDPYLTVVAVQSDYYQANKDLVKILFQAFHEGWKLYLKDPLPFNKKMNRLNPAMTLDIFNDGAKAQERFIQPLASDVIGTMETARWKKLGEQLMDLKLLKKIEPASNYFIEF